MQTDRGVTVAGVRTVVPLHPTLETALASAPREGPEAKRASRAYEPACQRTSSTKVSARRSGYCGFQGL